LWPETVVAGLFPGGCWLQRRGVEIARADAPACATPAQLLAALAAMLDGMERPLRRRTRVQLLLSDSLAAVVSLPWQELLRSEQEQRGYALACYERHGMQVDDSWVMQAGFRHFGGQGLAWALPAAWLQELLELLGARGLGLVSALPVTAAAYWRGATAGAARRLVLLREQSRLAVLTYEGGRLSGLDVQPVAGGEAASLARLLKRVAAGQAEPARLDEWSAMDSEPLTAAVDECFSGVAQRVLPRLAWS
jgi:hypothetical protein